MNQDSPIIKLARKQQPSTLDMAKMIHILYHEKYKCVEINNKKCWFEQYDNKEEWKYISLNNFKLKILKDIVKKMVLLNENIHNKVLDLVDDDENIHSQEANQLIRDAKIISRMIHALHEGLYKMHIFRHLHIFFYQLE